MAQFVKLDVIYAKLSSISLHEEDVLFNSTELKYEEHPTVNNTEFIYSIHEPFCWYYITLVSTQSIIGQYLLYMDNIELKL